MEMKMVQSLSSNKLFYSFEFENNANLLKQGRKVFSIIRGRKDPKF